MLNKKPRVPAPVQIPTQLSFLHGFKDYLIAQTVSPHTRNAYLSDLLQCSECSQVSMPEWSSDDVADVLLTLTKQGKSPRSIARCLSALRSFFKFLREQKLRSDNPVALHKTPKIGRALPKDLSEQDVDALIQAPDIETALGLRDRAMFEVLYACGLRVSELLNLRLDLINLKQGYLRITGKGNKERLVPLGQIAVEWVEKYFKVKRSSIEKQQHRLQKYGAILAGLSWLPFIGELFPLSLGFFKIKPFSVAMFMLAGISIRYIFITNLQQIFFNKYSKSYVL